jgi:hypothetical protein
MPPEETRARSETPGAGIGETVDLIRRYAIQETVGPLRRIGKRLLFGAAGGLVLGIGLVILLLAVLRALQTETGTFFAGNMSFGPYLATAAVGVGVMGVAGLVLLRAIGKGSRRRVR